MRLPYPLTPPPTQRKGQLNTGVVGPFGGRTQEEEDELRRATHNAFVLENVGDPAQNADNLALAERFGELTGAPGHPSSQLVGRYREQFGGSVQREETKATLTASPFLNAWASDIRNAEIAADDVGVLGRIERILFDGGQLRRPFKDGLFYPGSDLDNAAFVYGIGKLRAGGHYVAKTFHDIAADNARRLETYRRNFGLSQWERNARLASMSEPGFFASGGGPNPITDSARSHGLYWDGMTHEEYLHANPRMITRGEPSDMPLLTRAEWFFEAQEEGHLVAMLDLYRTIRTFPMRELPQKVYADYAAVNTWREGAGLTLDYAINNPGALVSAGANIGLMEGPTLLAAAPTAVINPALPGVIMGAAAGSSAAAAHEVDVLTGGGEIGGPDHVEAILADDLLRRRAANESLAYGVPIAAATWISFGAAKLALAKNALVNTAAQFPVQGAIGGAGEAAGSYLATGKVNIGEVFLEALGEGFTTPIDLTIAGVDVFVSRTAKTEQAPKVQQVLTELTEAAAESKLRERTPEAFRDFIGRMTEKAGTDTLYIDAPAFFGHLEAQGIGVEQAADLFPGVAIDQVFRAQNTGEDIALPLGSYLTDIAGTDTATVVIDNAKLDPHGLSAAGAQKFVETAPEAIAAIETLVADGTAKLVDNAATSAEVSSAVEARLLATGVSAPVAKYNAELWGAFFEAVAEESNTPVADLAKQFVTPAVRGPQGEAVGAQETTPTQQTAALDQSQETDTLNQSQEPDAQKQSQETDTSDQDVVHVGSLGLFANAVEELSTIASAREWNSIFDGMSDAHGNDIEWTGVRLWLGNGDTRVPDHTIADFIRKQQNTFYSPLFHALREGVPKKLRTEGAPGDRWRSLIENMGDKGVKKAELEWTGVIDWLSLHTSQAIPGDWQDVLSRLEPISSAGFNARGFDAWLASQKADVKLSRKKIAGAVRDNYNASIAGTPEAGGVSVADWLDDFERMGAPLRLQDVMEYVHANEIQLEEVVLDRDQDLDDLEVYTDVSDMDESAWDAELEYQTDAAREQLIEDYEGDDPDFEPSDEDVASLVDAYMEGARDTVRRYTVLVIGDDTFDGWFDPVEETYTFDALNITAEPENEVYVRANAHAARGTNVDGESTIHKNFTEKGGNNYREVLLTLPNLENTGPNEGSRAIPFKRTEHFYEENIVVHARLKDREVVGGGTAAFVEEVQSDLASDNRDNDKLRPTSESRQQYADLSERVSAKAAEVSQMEYDVQAGTGEDIASASREVVAVFKAQNLLTPEQIERAGYGLRAMFFNATTHNLQPGETYAPGHPPGSIEAVVDEAAALAIRDNPAVREAMAKQEAAVRAHEEAVAALDAPRDELRRLEVERGRVDPTLFNINLARTPFAGDQYVNLMVKRLLKDAADKGYSKLSWTPGYVQAHRWGKRHEVVRGVSWGPAEDGNKRLMLRTDRDTAPLVISPDGRFIEDDTGRSPMGKRRLAEVVGEDIAAQVLGEESGAVNPEHAFAMPHTGYAIVYDRQMRKAANAHIQRLLGENGPRVYNDTSLADFSGPRGNVWSIDITPELRNKLAGPQPLFQNTLGSIQLPAGGVGAGQATINLFENANVSTFAHESSHFFLDMIETLGTTPDAAPGIKGMYDQARAWWLSNAADIAKETGVNEASVRRYFSHGTSGNADIDQKVKTGKHEQWARAFETYLMEGKAPSPELRGVFAQFRAWLLRLYKQARGDLNVNMSDGIRRVFDRMLATDAQRQAAEAANHGGPMGESAEAMGISEPEYQALKRAHQEAQNETTEATNERAALPLRIFSDPAKATRREEVQARVEEEVAEQPVYRAITVFGTKHPLDAEGQPTASEGPRLDRKQLIERYGKEALDALPRGQSGRRVYVNNGLDLDEAASWFDFGSGDGMVQAMLNAPPREDAVAAETERRLMGESARDEKYAAGVKDADDAFHSPKRGDAIASDLRTLKKQAGETDLADPAAYAEDAQARARQELHGRPLREALDSGTFLAAERRAGEAARAALAAGDPATAAQHKEQQLESHMLYAESRAVDEQVAETARLAQRLGAEAAQDPESLRGRAINDVLARYPLPVADAQQFHVADAHRELSVGGVQAYVNSLKAQQRDLEIGIPASVLNQNSDALGIEEVTDLRETLLNIEHTEQGDGKLNTADSSEDMSEKILSITEAVAENIKGREPDIENTFGNKINHGYNQFVDATRTPRQIAQEADGFAILDRPVFNALAKPVKAAGLRALERKRAAAEYMEKELFGRYTEKEKGQMSVRRQVPGTTLTLSRWGAIATALNTGNAGNIERLTAKARVDAAYTTHEVEAITAQLTKKDWDFVQAAWDYLDSFFPEIAAREERVKGVAPERVEATPVVTPYGVYRGGYYPLRYAAHLARGGEEVDSEGGSTTDPDEMTNAEVELSMRSGMFAAAHTRDGHLQARGQKNDRSVLIDIGVLVTHVDTLIHDLELSEVVSNAWRLMTHSAVEAAFINVGRQASIDTLKLWLKDTATGPRAASHFTEKWTRWLISGVTTSKLAHSVSTAAVQVTGLTQIAGRVGARPFVAALASHLSNPAANQRFILGKSAFMRARKATFSRELVDMHTHFRADFSRARGTNRFLDTYIRYTGFWFIQNAQLYAADLPAWTAAYNHALALPGATEDQAVDWADTIVAETQTSGLWHERSGLIRGTLSEDSRQAKFLRTYTIFGSWAFNRTAEFVNSTRQHGFGPIGIAKLTGIFLVRYVIEDLMYNLIKGNDFPGGEDDDESWPAYLAKSGIYSFFSGVPFAREGSSVVRGFDGGGGYGTLMKTLGRTVVDYTDGEFDLDDVTSTVDVIGIFGHLPAAAFNRALEAAVKQGQGEDINWLDYIR